LKLAIYDFILKQRQNPQHKTPLLKQKRQAREKVGMKAITFMRTHENYEAFRHQFSSCKKIEKRHETTWFLALTWQFIKKIVTSLNTCVDRNSHKLFVVETLFFMMLITTFSKFFQIITTLYVLCFLLTIESLDIDI
jgi:hypothetical protein